MVLIFACWFEKYGIAIGIAGLLIRDFEQFLSNIL